MRTKLFSIIIFRVEQLELAGGAGERCVHRQPPQAGSTVLLQIQTGSFGEPPTPSASDLTVALDQY